MYMILFYIDLRFDLFNSMVSHNINFMQLGSKSQYVLLMNKNNISTCTKTCKYTIQDVAKKAKSSILILFQFSISFIASLFLLHF